MRNRTKVFILLFLSGVLYILDVSGLLNGLKSIIDPSIVSIKQSVFSTVSSLTSIGDIIVSYEDIKQSRSQHTKLVQEKEELLHANRALMDENKELRLQLGATNPSTFRFAPAALLGISEFIEVASGSRDGVSLNMAVLHGASLVGSVSAVSPHRSRVTPLRHPSTAIPARSSRGVSGVVTGLSGGQVVFDHVLQKDPVFIDDQVFTSGGEGFPPNILIGTITHIAKSDVSVYKQATLQPSVDISAIKSVFIILSS